MPCCHRGRDSRSFGSASDWQYNMRQATAAGLYSACSANAVAHARDQAFWSRTRAADSRDLENCSRAMLRRLDRSDEPIGRLLGRVHDAAPPILELENHVVELVGVVGLTLRRSVHAPAQRTVVARPSRVNAGTRCAT